jgi:hypothetical protein
MRLEQYQRDKPDLPLVAHERQGRGPSSLAARSQGPAGAKPGCGPGAALSLSTFPRNHRGSGVEFFSLKGR